MAHEMNLIFILTGILTATGAVLLHPFWASSKLTISATILILGLPAGLMQRRLYCSVWCWMDVAATVLWRKSYCSSSRLPPDSRESDIFYIKKTPHLNAQCRKYLFAGFLLFIVCRLFSGIETQLFSFFVQCFRTVFRGF